VFIRRELMSKPTDIYVIGASLYFIPIQMRIPLKFGAETVTGVTCARACVRVANREGRSAEGWGETPLSVQWVWPSKTAYEVRHKMLKDCCANLAEAWVDFGEFGHPMEIGYDFQELVLPGLLSGMNGTSPESKRGLLAVGGGRQPTSEADGGQPSAARRRRALPGLDEPMPWLAALVCCSVFDQAIHDAYGNLLQRPVYETYGPEFVSRDLSGFLEPVEDASISLSGKFVQDFLLPKRMNQLRAWHLVGGLDLLDKSELSGNEPDDGYPVLLTEWIGRDGLKCLKVKLCGNDAEWDFQRMVKIGRIAVEHGVEQLSADFNCTVTDPAYVNDVLDRLRTEHPRIFEMILYVEQPFPYELEEHRIDVHSVSSRKPLFLDESAHNWRLVKLGRELGWTGVALKTCKTQSGALLSACWAKAHGIQLMVQDLTNPMLAQIPHVLLAAHVGTIMGVETNAMQFYPEASAPEAAVHPGIYCRRDGRVDLSSIHGPGFGYRWDEIRRELPPPTSAFQV
jgi:L-alanine-DL-glutamate epimerase-like enolase superfamily enzyme